jgi:hypothetical protein
MKSNKIKKIDPLKPSVKCTTLPDGRPGELYFIPKLGFTIGVCPQDRRSPITMIVKDDDSLAYYMTTKGPVARIATENGHLVFSSAGIRLINKEKTTMIPFSETKQIAKTITDTITNDSITRSALAFLPGAVSIVAYLGCSKGLLPPINVSLLDIPKRIVECTEEWIEAIYETINKTWECIVDAWDDYMDCWDDCSGLLKWFCRGGCTAAWLVKELYCAGLGIVKVLVQAGYYVTNCIVTQGLVTDDSISSGDILIFEADSIAGYAIDFATCGYGYSHAGIVCGSNIIEATGEGVIERPLKAATSRNHEVIRLGLSSQQISELCACVRSNIGEDYDYLEAITFGTFDDPGKEICTMLIMHCLDEIGVNRAELGLGGFVSPNDIARNFGAPRRL